MTKARENSDYTGLQGDLAGLQPLYARPPVRPPFDARNYPLQPAMNENAMAKWINRTKYVLRFFGVIFLFVLLGDNSEQ